MDEHRATVTDTLYGFMWSKDRYPPCTVERYMSLDDDSEFVRRVKDLLHRLEVLDE